MKKSFLEWLREVFSNDHAVKQQYKLDWLIAEYPELYDDFKEGNNTDFAKLFRSKNLDWGSYSDIRKIYESQQRKIETLEKQQLQG